MRTTQATPVLRSPDHEGFPAPGRPGTPVRIAVIDSGVHVTHPHVGGVIGGAWFGPDGATGADYVDRLGHGTAVTAAIHEKAPRAEILALKVFDSALAAPVSSLVAAIGWASRHGSHLINLSLGTARSEDRQALEPAIAQAVAAGALVVAAGPDRETCWLPGSLPDVLRVAVDWTCPRDRVRSRVGSDGGVVVLASGYPRPIPGVAPERNLKGLSFAVANVTGLVAAAVGSGTPLSPADAVQRLVRTFGCPPCGGAPA